MAHSVQTGQHASLLDRLEEIFQDAANRAFPGLDEKVALQCTKQSNFGDYQCNSAMKFFNLLKGKAGECKNPRQVGEALVANLGENDVIEGTPTLAGPGFINIKVNPSYIDMELTLLLREGIRTWAPHLPYKRALVDFSSPNVAKEMHVGHLRSTIIGDTISRTLEFCGVQTLRINHIGDWGTQFGMLIQYISELHNGDLAAVCTDDVSDLQTLYQKSKVRFDEDVDFKVAAREKVRLLQGGDKECVNVWKRICESSFREFNAIYDRLGVKLETRGESFYNDRLSYWVKKLMDDGYAEVSEGAKVIFVDGLKVPLMIEKSDGGYGYGTTDIVALNQRIYDENADLIVYVTDIGQSGHFELIFKSAKKAGFLNPPKDNVVLSHVGFGVVLNADGSRIKTREGKAVRLVELLDEARDRCKKSILERRQERIEAAAAAGAAAPADEDDVDMDEVDKVATIMGYAAVKYMDLKNNRKTDYKFSFDAMLDLKGDTAVYLLYAHARISSIIRKVETSKNIRVSDLLGSEQMQLKHKSEVALGLHLCRFPEAIRELLAEYQPNRVCEFLFELSNKFTTFYTDCQVLGSEEEISRLLLCEATAVTMRQCFSLLGITPLYKI